MRHFFLLLFAVLCFASSAVAAHVRTDGATVIVNEVRVLTFRTSVGNSNPRERAGIFAANLERSNFDLQVKRKRRSHQIVAGGRLLVTIGQEEARASGSSTGSLAAAWVRNIRSAAKLPPLKLESTQLKIPNGATRTIRLVGSKAFYAGVSSSDGTVVRASKTPEGVSIKAIGYGSATVTVTAGASSEKIRISALPFAANFPQTLQAGVTGIPATSETVRGALDNALRTQLATVPEATWQFELPQSTQILPGESRTFIVRVRAAADDAFPAEGNVAVTIKNVALPRVSEAELWYCNEPENIKRVGLLFAAPLRREVPARLLYHHINVASAPLYVQVEAVNASSQPAKLMIIPGDSKPDRNPVFAGIEAADQFVRGWLVNSAEIVTVPPKSSLPIAIRRLSDGETMSGLCYLRLLEGGPDDLLIRTDAKTPFAPDARWKAAMASSAPWRKVGAQKLTEGETRAAVTSVHIYPNPFKEGEMSYSVGGKYAFFRLGERAIARADRGKALDGNFGVTYTINASIENPTTTPTDVELVFEASAGYTGALLVVNGQYVRTPLLQPKSEIQVMRFRLEPGSSKSIKIMTVPLSGSSYPATLTLRPVANSK